MNASLVWTGASGTERTPKGSQEGGCGPSRAAALGFGMTDFGRLDEIIAAGPEAASMRLGEIERVTAAASATAPEDSVESKGRARAHDHSS